MNPEKDDFRNLEIIAPNEHPPTFENKNLSSERRLGSDSGQEGSFQDHQLTDIHLEFPPLPKGPLVSSLVMLVLGTVLIIVGFVEEVVDIDPTRGIAFWILGGLLFIPGIYYAVKFYRIYKAPTPLQRQKMLEDIPAFDCF
mmetsp:Transcript_8445/g.12467  ORF Transcript_8445/g.12467 Transcript_8445/m.12467 type:complete len:141 (+) Transcript_8445:601-1023(+)